MENKINGRVFSPLIGHGNPGSALSIAGILGYQKNLLFSKTLAEIHGFFNKKPEFVNEYSKNSEALRGGLGMIAIGLLQLWSWLGQERFNLKGKLADVGVFVQEHLLGVLPENLIKQWFPSGVFLAIPDVLPKQSATTILKEKEVITPIVWNKTAYKELKKQGVKPILVAPFLPEGFVGQVDFKDKQLSRKIVVKSSGSGMPNEWVERLMGYSKRENIDMEIWLPDQKITIANGQKNVEDLKGKSLEEYLKAFYQSLVDSPPEYLVSFPSEMVQVASWMRSRGWNGVFAALPPKGQHEIKNLQWAERFLRTARVNFNNPQLDILNQAILELQTDLLKELGKDNISIIKNLKRDYRLLEDWLNRNNKKHKKYLEELVKEYSLNPSSIVNLHPQDQLKVAELLIRFGEDKTQGIQAFLNILKKYSDSRGFIRKLYKESFKMFDLNLNEKKMLLREIFSGKNLTGGQIEDLINFSFKEEKNNWEFYGLLANYIDKLIEYYQLKGKNLERKVNRGLYIRHILRAAALADSLLSKGFSELVGEENYQRFILTALFHDALEMNPDKKEKIEEFLREKDILESVQTLTPEKHGDGEAAIQYLQRKKRHSDKVFGSNDDIALFTYFCDKLAVLEETIDDLNKNGQNEVKKMKRPLSLRYLVFADAYKTFKERLSENQYLLERFKTLLQQLFEKITENSNLKQIAQSLQEDGKYKYCLSGNSIVLASEDFIHQNMIQGPEQDWVGGVIKVSIDPFNIVFISSSSSIPKDEDGGGFFEFLAQEGGKIEFKKVNLNNLFAGLTYE